MSAAVMSEGIRLLVEAVSDLFHGIRQFSSHSFCSGWPSV